MDTIWLWTTAGWREYVEGPGFSDYSGSNVDRSNLAVIVAACDDTDGAPTRDGGAHLGSLATWRTVGPTLGYAGTAPEGPGMTPEPTYLRDWNHVPEPCDVVSYIGGHGTEGCYLRADSEHAIGWLATMADYPLLDEGHFSEMEEELKGDAWEGLSIRDRIELLSRRPGHYPQVSCFAARHGWGRLMDLYSDDLDSNGWLSERLLQRG